MNYTYRSYRSLLTEIRACGRIICPFREVPDSGPYVILRHDVDYSLIKAREMAAVEHELGVRATVFVLLTSPYYNLLADEQLRAARDIAAMGHEIGLHYDTDSLIASAPQGQCEQIVRMAGFLEEIVGSPVTAVAQHNPSVTSMRVSIPGYLDAYSERFFKDSMYLSDSRRLFSTPDIHAFFSSHPRAQLLIHPLWWHQEEKNRWQAFVSVRDAIVTDIESRLDQINASMEADERRMRAG